MLVRFIAICAPTLLNARHNEVGLHSMQADNASNSFNAMQASRLSYDMAQAGPPDLEVERGELLEVRDVLACDNGGHSTVQLGQLTINCTTDNINCTQQSLYTTNCTQLNTTVHNGDLNPKSRSRSRDRCTVLFDEEGDIGSFSD